jgi:hypothetical protein
MKKKTKHLQYQLYLKKVGFDESKMNPIMASELKRCFMGACGQILLICCNDVAALDDDMAMVMLDDMLKQVKDFFINESLEKN